MHYHELYSIVVIAVMDYLLLTFLFVVSIVLTNLPLLELQISKMTFFRNQYFFQKYNMSSYYPSGQQFSYGLHVNFVPQGSYTQIPYNVHIPL